MTHKKLVLFLLNYIYCQIQYKDSLTIYLSSRYIQKIKYWIYYNIIYNISKARFLLFKILKLKKCLILKYMVKCISLLPLRTKFIAINVSQLPFISA